MTAVWLLLPVALIGVGAAYARIAAGRRARRGNSPMLLRLEAVVGTAAMGVAAGVAGVFAIVHGSPRSEVGGILLILAAFILIGWTVWIAWWTRGDGWFSPPSRHRRGPSPQ